MGALGKPEPLPYVDEDDLADLAVDMGAGWHTADDLYRWYTGLLTEFGRAPVTKTTFGLALKEARLTPSMRRVHGKMCRGWLLTKPWERRGQARLAAQRAASQI